MNRECPLSGKLGGRINRPLLADVSQSVSMTASDPLLPVTNGSYRAAHFGLSTTAKRQKGAFFGRRSGRGVMAAERRPNAADLQARGSGAWLPVSADRFRPLISVEQPELSVEIPTVPEIPLLHELAIRYSIDLHFVERNGAIPSWD